MVTIDLAGSSLVVNVEGLDKLWSFKSRLEIPIQHVAGVERDTEEAKKWYHGIRAPGTSLPGVITAGTFYQHGERVFWDVHNPENAIAIRLHDERYQRLVVEVADPDAIIAKIRAALAQ